MEKSSITFGVKVLEEVKEEIHQKLGITNVGGASSYLHFLNVSVDPKVEILDFIKDKSKERFLTWFSKTVSQSSKEPLLKSLSMEMFAYAMSCFKLPKTT